MTETERQIWAAAFGAAFMEAAKGLAEANNTNAADLLMEPFAQAEAGRLARVAAGQAVLAFRESGGGAGLFVGTEDKS